jgi:hypothetical protein
MKIYVAAVEALRKNERQGETQFSTEIDGFFVSPPPPPPLNVNVFFFQGFYESHLGYDQTQCSNAIYFLFIKYSIISLLYTFNNQTFLQIHIN